MSIKDNYNFIKERIGSAALRSGAAAESVKIVSVSKTLAAEIVQEAVNDGISIFGENRVQEAKAKIPLLSGNFAFHLIGHLQSNKARDAVALFDLIHSIDSLAVSERVNAEAQKAGKIQDILIQVNIAGEAAKSGAAADNAIELAGKCLTMKNINLLGFMNIAPLTDDINIIRKSFSGTREVLEKTNRLYGTSMKELSMGMSGDFETAVEEGATIVRVGSLIFGERR
jgi:pyridoxal phosphate enzyme (YggS family)